MKPSAALLSALALCALSSSGCGGSSQPPPAAVAPATASAPPSAPAADDSAKAATAAAPAAATAPAPKLKLQVITASPEGFLVNSTLVSGEKEAVLIDAQFTLADAKKVADAVRATNKTLTTVYVTHAHPDHYFGFVALKEAFPSAKLVALPATVAGIQKTWEDKVKTWKPMYKDAITAKPIIPEPLSGTSIDLEGEKLEIVGDLQGDGPNNSYVWIPSLRTVVTGDIVYDAVFPWTAETTPETRKAWSESLDKLAALNPATVVPGHQKPEKKQEPSDIQFTKEYLKAYDEAVAASKTPAEVQTKIKAEYPDAALDIVLKLGSEAAFKKPGKHAKKEAPAKDAPAKEAPAKETSAK
jgi:glyoxylase-like metal-dependent hydrolase (beta-lactamase superfamily II)